jgi:hypothetical protein
MMSNSTKPTKAIAWMMLPYTLATVLVVWMTVGNIDGVMGGVLGVIGGIVCALLGIYAGHQLSKSPPL